MKRFWLLFFSVCLLIAFLGKDGIFHYGFVQGVFGLTLFVVSVLYLFNKSAQSNIDNALRITKPSSLKRGLACAFFVYVGVLQMLAPVGLLPDFSNKVLITKSEVRRHQMMSTAQKEPSVQEASSRISHPVIGKWLDRYGTDFIEFSPNGEIHMSSKLSELNQIGTGKFQVIEPNRLRVSLPNSPKPNTRDSQWEIKFIDSDSLIITLPSNEVPWNFEASLWHRIK